MVELDDFGRQVRLRIVAENHRIQLSQARLVTTLIMTNTIIALIARP